MGTRFLDLRSETGRDRLSDGKRLSGHNLLTNILITKIQIHYGMAIRNIIIDLHSMKTSVWAVSFHLRSSNESPQHGLCQAGIMTCANFKRQKLNVTKGTMIINTSTRAIHDRELNEANF
ncbi:hypothetical protein TNCV_4592481 [Trichonephila clavipes]|nr:hypothetical protein TNCV_4592481 [Trichonephila clavipes]